MMNPYLTNISPDSFSGILFAMEGVENVLTLLNGPSGCKFYHSATSDSQALRQKEFDPLNYPEEWYFGQPRIPCTFLDRRDYVYGSKEKLLDGIAFFKERVSFDLLCVVNSPGAALIGDDLAGILSLALDDIPYITVETPGFSSNVCRGYETGVLSLLRQLEAKRLTVPAEPLTVNLLGISIYHNYHEGDLKELKRLFALCGIGVHCCVCAGCSLTELLSLPQASLNVVVRPEYGLETARYLAETCGTPYYVCDGPPVGFAATEKMMTDICRILGADPTAVITESERARGRAYVHLSRLNSLTGLPRGVAFSVEGTWSEAYAYGSFLIHYLGMAPVCFSITSPDSDCRQSLLLSLAEQYKCPQTLEADILETPGEIVLANGCTIAKLKLTHHIFSGIENALPGMGYINVTPKTHLGINGALFLLEQVLNGLTYSY